MGAAKKTPLETSVEHALANLEAVTDQIPREAAPHGHECERAWNDKLEPRLFEARRRAREGE